MKLKLLSILLSCQCFLIAQIDYDKFPEVTTTYFINDVHIQKTPIDSFGLGDILIEDGYIAQVARSINPPANAYIIEGDSAYVYPAFIAALSHTGIAKKDRKGEKPDVKFQGHPPNVVVGITPEANASEQVNVNDESIRKMKASGFALAHVVPRGKMLPGQGSLMLLTGDTNEDMLMADNQSLFFQLAGTRGYYPTTVIGVMAKWRDLYRQASYLAKHQAISKLQSGAIKRAKADKSLEALIPVTKDRLPVFTKAEKAKDIHRAIALQKDLGYKLVLAEVKQAGPALNKIKKDNIPVLISAKLPKEEKSDKKKTDKKAVDKEPTEAEVINGTKVKSVPKKVVKKVQPKKNKKDKETLALEARKKASYEAYVGQAAALESAGVPFAISFLESNPGDLKKTLKRMMKAGLSQSGALAALTTHPAKILGVDTKVGTISKGKLANLFLSDAPYFSEKSNIKIVFVEGQMTELEIKPQKKKGSENADEDFRKRLVGTWSYEVETPMGIFAGTVITSGEDDLKIKVFDDEGNLMEGRDIVIGDEELSFVISIDMEGTLVPATMDLSYDGNSFEGTVTMPGMGSMPISGDKIPDSFGN